MKDKAVLCFGDSNTWGANPSDISRFDRHVRWTGILGHMLGENYLIHEEGLPNRTSCFDDPLIAYRSGLAYLPVALETHAPLEWVVIMLGTNDAKKRIDGSPIKSEDGIRAMADLGLRAGANVLVVSPPVIRPPVLFDEFDGDASEKYVEELSELLAKDRDRAFKFLDSRCFVQVSQLDGVHLDESGHRRLADVVASFVRGERN